MWHEFDELSSRYESLVGGAGGVDEQYGGGYNAYSGYSGYGGYSTKKLNYNGRNSAAETVDMLKSVGRMFKCTVDTLQLQFTAGSASVDSSNNSNRGLNSFTIASIYSNEGGSDSDKETHSASRQRSTTGSTSTKGSAGGKTKYINTPLVTGSMTLTPEHIPYTNPNPPDNLEQANGKGGQGWVWNIAGLSG